MGALRQQMSCNPLAPSLALHLESMRSIDDQARKNYLRFCDFHTSSDMTLFEVEKSTLAAQG